MGLEMGFYGEVDVRPTAIGALCMKTYLLGEWQNHHALHELICSESGEDPRSHLVKTYLLDHDLKAILGKLEGGSLAYSPERMGLHVHTLEQDMAQFNFIIHWINQNSHKERSVYYEALR